MEIRIPKNPQKVLQNKSRRTKILREPPEELPALQPPLPAHQGQHVPPIIGFEVEPDVCQVSGARNQVKCIR